MKNLSIIVFLTGICLSMLPPAGAAEAKTNKTETATNKVEVSIFPDKNLEAAVRKFVFEKRDNNKPITEPDVASLSTISGQGLQIKDLTGLDKCKSLASLDLAKNQIANLGPLKDL